MNTKFLAISAVVALTLLGFRSATENPLPTNSMMTEGAYFPSTLVNEMLSRRGCDAIRFYKVEFPVESGASIMAVSVSGEADMAVQGSQTSKYQLFQGIDGASANIGALSANDAKAACTNLAGGALAVTISKKEIADMLAVEGTTGLAIYEATNPNDEPSLMAQSALILEGQCTMANGALSFMGVSPCPSACGSNPAGNYIINLME